MPHLTLEMAVGLWQSSHFQHQRTQGRIRLPAVLYLPRISIYYFELLTITKVSLYWSWQELKIFYKFETLDACDFFSIIAIGCVYTWGGRFCQINLQFRLPWNTLVEGGKERYRPPGKLTLELVLANQNKKTFMFMDYPAYQVGQ